MDELTLDNQKYLSSKRAAQVTGYAKDYVGQLCREGHVEARLVGRNWYVLETSILDHRFGKEEKPKEEVSPTSEELESTWQTPTYSTEPIRSIPELAPKPRNVAPVAPPAPESAQVLADMQAAWKEWFENQPKELPDADSMLLADQEEEPMTPEVQTQAEPNTVEEEEVGEETVVPIHVERHNSAAAPISRSERYEIPDRYQEIVRQSRPAETRTRAEERRMRRSNSGSSTVLRAVFVGLALIAVAATLIGSGLLDRSLNVDGHSFVTDFLSGRSEVKK